METSSPIADTERAISAPGFEYQGRMFTLPAPGVAINKEDRLALAFLTGGVVRFGADLVQDALEPGAVDLGFVRSGRCPLLLEHCYSVDALMGQVVDAEIDGPLLRAMVRFARGPEADRLWGMICDGFPLSLSAGARVKHAIVVAEQPERVIRVTRWELAEVSVVVFGKDSAAHVRRLNWNENAGEIVAQMAERGGGKQRAAVRAALHLDRWDRWVTPAGCRMAEALEVDRDRICNLLTAEVQRHAEQLVADLAA